MRINYINLTNGIELLPKLQGDYRFIRIQSSICEQKIEVWDYRTSVKNWIHIRC